MIVEFYIMLVILAVAIGCGIFLLKKEKASRKEGLLSVNHKQTTRTSGNMPAKHTVIPCLSDLPITQPQVLAIKSQLEGVIIGQDQLVYGLLLGLFAARHVLIQSLPGMAKTLAVKTLSQIIGLSFSRIQGTPDLMPMDMLVGYHGGKAPIDAQMILFDEINRTTPKVQSALMECMQEQQFTVDGKTHDLPYPFIVFATSNPVGSRGIYELPEAQLDRFGLSIVLNYPENEKDIIRDAKNAKSAKTAENSSIDFKVIYTQIHAMEVSDEIVDFVTSIVQQTRSLEGVLVGCSPRSGKDLLWFAKTLAWMRGKKSVSKEEVKSLVDMVLGHRVVWLRGGKKILSEELFVPI